MNIEWLRKEYVHIAVFDILNALIDVLTDFLPYGDAKIAFQLGTAPHFSCKDRS